MDTFFLFSSLPAELRVEIWRLSCQARVVEVHYDQDTDRCLSHTKPPSILHVNREAREEALMLYQKAFVTESQLDYIYFCPALDTLYLPRHGLMGYDDTAREFNKLVVNTSAHVQSLAIDHVKTDIIRPWEPYNKFCLLQNFPNLTEAFLVVGSDPDAMDSSYGDEVELVEPKGDTAAVIRLVDDVVASFCREIEPVGWGLDCHDPVLSQPTIPSLIPKSKAFHHGSLEFGSAISCA